MRDVTIHKIKSEPTFKLLWRPYLSREKRAAKYGYSKVRTLYEEDEVATVQILLLVIVPSSDIYEGRISELELVGNGHHQVMPPYAAAHQISYTGRERRLG